MCAEVTGLSHPMRSLWVILIRPVRIILVIEESRVVGTGDHTVSATDTTVMIHDDDPIVAFVGRLYGTDLGAWRVFTVVTQQRDHFLFGSVGVLVFNSNFPNPMDVPTFVSMESYIVLFPAGVHTFRTLWYAFIEINHHPPFVFRQPALFACPCRTATGQQEQAVPTDSPRYQNAACP